MGARVIFSNGGKGVEAMQALSGVQKGRGVFPSPANWEVSGASIAGLPSRVRVENEFGALLASQNTYGETMTAPLMSYKLFPLP